MKFLLLLTVAATILLVSSAEPQCGIFGHRPCSVGKRSVSEAEPAAHAHSLNVDDGLHGGHGAGGSLSAVRETRAAGRVVCTFAGCI